MKIDSINTNVGIRHLEAAVTIRNEGSFVRAAERLNVAPSALTETIRQIEEFADLALFDRTTRPVRPREEAVAFLDQAEAILRKFRDTLTDLRRIGSLERGCVRVGVAPSIALHLLAPTIASFRVQHPMIDIDIHDDVAGRVVELVRAGTVDLGIVAFGQSDTEIREEMLLKDYFGLVCHRSHPLADRETPPALADIDPTEIISLQADTGISRMLQECLSIPVALRAGRIQTYSTISQLTLISRNLGVALMPRLAVDVIQSPNLVFRDISDLKLERTFYALTRRRSSHTVAMTSFLTHLKEVLTRLTETMNNRA